MKIWPDPPPIDRTLEPLGQPLISLKTVSDNWDWNTMARWTPETGWSPETVWLDGEW